MSHIIIFDKKRNWYGANWAGRNLVYRVREHLPQDSSKHLVERLGHIDDFPGCNVDLSELSVDELRALLAAAEKAVAATRAAGPSSFQDPSFFPGFLQKFEEFTHMVEDKIEAVTKNRV